MQLTVSVPDHLAPALRSAVEMVSSTVGEKLSGPMESKRTQAITDAAIALGMLRKACTEQIAKTNPHLGK